MIYLLLMNHFWTHSATCHLMFHTEEMFNSISMKFTEFQPWIWVYLWVCILLCLLQLLGLECWLLELSEQMLLWIQHISASMQSTLGIDILSHPGENTMINLGYANNITGNLSIESRCLINFKHNGHLTRRFLIVNIIQVPVEIS